MPLLITYDLEDPAHESALLKYLDDNAAKMVAKSSYVVLTDKDSKSVVIEIRAITKDAIVVYVLPLAKGWFGFGRKDANDYLHSVFPSP